MSAERYLVVNADDYGQSPGVNAGVVEAFEKGIVTSASLMVRWPAAEEAADFARASGLSVGLHVDLGEWAALGSEWIPLYEVVPPANEHAVRDEVEAQLASFRELVGTDPTHLDSHQHVHRREPARSVLVELAARLGVPLRGCTESIRYCGAFYGQTEDGLPRPDAVSATSLVQLLGRLEPGFTELACHPGRGYDVRSMYAAERTLEVAALCDGAVRAALDRERIRLITFRDVREVAVAPAANQTQAD